MWASESGCVDVVKELLGAMAGVDVQDEVHYLCWELKSQLWWILDIEKGGFNGVMACAKYAPTF